MLKLAGGKIQFDWLDSSIAVIGRIQYSSSNMNKYNKNINIKYSAHNTVPEQPPSSVLTELASPKYIRQITVHVPVLIEMYTS